VAGTHGKTTTTAMTTEVLARAGRDPTGLVGGRVVGWESNLRFGGGSLFVVEADEYDRSFLHLAPDVAIVTNVEADHLDVYGDYEGVRAGFGDFVGRIRGGGRVVLCADDPGASSLAPIVGPAAYTYGTSAGAMLRGVDVAVGPKGVRCTVLEDGRRVGILELERGGRHTLLNALASAGVARALDVGWSTIDDYAHHQTEIRATLDAARAAFADARIVAVFQPHLYSRTRDFTREFGLSLSRADVVWVTDIFPAREAAIPGVTGESIASAARAAGAPQVHYHAELTTLAERLADALSAGDVVITLGAGSIEGLGEQLLDRLGVPAHA
jgi:UDP-N-acetylmuramate--alanine ligase